MSIEDSNNPYIIEQGKATRFGQPGGPAPHRGGDVKHSWNIRKAMRHLAAQKIDVTDPGAIDKLIKARPEMTIAEAIAFKYIKKALMGHDRAIKYVTDCVDGKQPQTTMHSNFDLDASEKKAEVDAARKKLRSRLIPQ